MLNCRDLAKSYGRLEVIRGVSLRLAPGDRHAVIGPNGAGKTTFLNLLSGEAMPDRGQITLGDVDVTRLPPNRRARLGMGRSFQRNACFPDMTVAENLEVACALARERSVRAAGRMVAQSVGVLEWWDMPVEALSYGTLRQLELGLALAGRPRLLLLDEPTAGMSPRETERMRALIAALPAELTVLLIEHDMDVVFSIADEITVLDRGEILMRGTPDAVRASDLVRARYLGEAEA